MSGSVAGMLLGLVFALGAVLIGGALSARRSPSLASRVVPYLPNGSDWSAGPAIASTAPVKPGNGLPRRVRSAAYVVGLAGVVDRVTGGRRSVGWRLEAVGDPRSVDEFRVDQVLAAGLGGLWGLGAAGVASMATGHVAWVSGSILVATGLVLGMLTPDWRLTRLVRRREESIAAELPVVAELLALAVTAGEGVTGALERIASSCGGVLAAEFRRVHMRVNAGVRLTTALRELADRTRVTGAIRLVDVIVVALDRGTPLADVLRAQAADVMSARRQQLVVESGKRSIAMLVPVVFLILPVTVLFAVYPGLVSIVSLTR